MPQIISERVCHDVDNDQSWPNLASKLGRMLNQCCPYIRCSLQKLPGSESDIKRDISMVCIKPFCKIKSFPPLEPIIVTVKNCGWTILESKDGEWRDIQPTTQTVAERCEESLVESARKFTEQNAVYVRAAETLINLEVEKRICHQRWLEHAATFFQTSPLEIRSFVWFYACRLDREVIPFRHQQSQRNHRGPRKNNPSISGLLTAEKALSNEVRELLYTTAKFRFKDPVQLKSLISQVFRGDLCRM